MHSKIREMGQSCKVGRITRALMKAGRHSLYKHSVSKLELPAGATESDMIDLWFIIDL